MTPREEKKYARLVDKLVKLQTRIADLTDEADDIKKQLIEGGHEEYRGTEAYRAVVSSFEQERIDTEAVRGMLSPEALKQVTKQVPCTQVRVYPF